MNNYRVQMIGGERFNVIHAEYQVQADGETHAQALACDLYKEQYGVDMESHHLFAVVV